MGYDFYKKVNMTDSADVISFSVGDDSLWFQLDTADTVTIDDGELNVALITPGGSPRVLDEPVIETSSLIVAIADGEDSVIKAGAAGG